MMRFGTVGRSTVFGALALASTLAACVDPKSDYDSFIARTADAQTASQGDDAAVFDGAGGDASGFSNQTYAMACISQATPTAADATQFFAQATFTPRDTSGDGTFDFTDTAIVVGATDIHQTAGGPPYPVVGSAVTGGKVDVVFGPTTIPGAADPLGSDIVFTGSTLHFLIGPGDALCATLSGTVTAPLSIPMLDPSKNICIFRPSTGPVAPFTTADFHCP